MRAPTLLLLLALPVGATRADVSPVSKAFQVSATVASGCAFGTTLSSSNYNLGNLNFGTLASLATPVSVASSAGSGSIVLTCTPGMTVSIALDYGTNGASASQRYLRQGSGSETLAYQLYRDAAYSQVWGTGALALSVPSFPAATQTYTVYARLLASSSLPSAGTYTDTVTVTLTY
ncbi:MAG: hypothetical protein GAK45_01110 [Pseudomonas citronellolis]|nr:MAG: hypothetical protein GAK45_01110 [Pseudomonas citronellolis]